LDKDASKHVFRDRGLCTPDWAVLAKADSPVRRAELLGALPLPLVIKPVDGGSSVDVVIAREESSRDRALEELLDKYGRILVERFVAGREMTVGVLGRRTLPVLEIIPAREFYDYEAKYADGAGTQYRFDHGLPPDVVGAMESAAWTAFECLGCRDMGRVDFLLDAQGTAWLLEVNTIPGFTGHSLLPMAAARAGLSFDELVGRILESARARSRAERAAHGG
jgi:D-alanine-D-alanine ligase